MNSSQDRVWKWIGRFEIIHALLGGWGTIGAFLLVGISVLVSVISTYYVASIIIAALGLMIIWFAIQEWRVKRAPQPSDRSRRMPRHITGKTIQITDLADDNGRVADRTIEDCEVWGPAILITYKDQIDKCVMDDVEHVTPGPREWNAARIGDDPAGSVRLIRTVFKRCRFHNIGYVMPRPEEHEQRSKSTSTITDDKRSGTGLSELLLTRAWRLSISGGRTKRMTFGQGGVVVDGRNDHEHAWSLDGSTLTFFTPDNVVYNVMQWTEDVNGFVSINAPNSLACKHGFRDQLLVPGAIP